MKSKSFTPPLTTRPRRNSTSSKPYWRRRAHRGNGTALCFPAVDPDRRPESATRTGRSASASADPGDLARSDEALVRQKAVLMLFEDAHWADATSVEVL